MDLGSGPSSVESSVEATSDRYGGDDYDSTNGVVVVTACQIFSDT